MKIGEHKVVKSMSDTSRTYKIYNTVDGYKCTCPAYFYGSHQKCNHIRQMQHLKLKRSANTKKV